MREMKEFDGAIKIYEDVLALRKELEPNKKIEQAVCMSSMAGAYREISRYDQAETYLKSALDIFMKELGEYHLNTATCFNNIAMNYKRQKKYSKAEEYYLR
jgi:tetratricopeptide (TPR) repeat protein